jgi:hypothetical protein
MVLLLMVLLRSDLKGIHHIEHVTLICVRRRTCMRARRTGLVWGREVSKSQRSKVFSKSSAHEPASVSNVKISMKVHCCVCLS